MLYIWNKIEAVMLSQKGPFWTNFWEDLRAFFNLLIKSIYANFLIQTFRVCITKSVKKCLSIKLFSIFKELFHDIFGSFMIKKRATSKKNDIHIFSFHSNENWKKCLFILIIISYKDFKFHINLNIMSSI